MTTKNARRGPLAGAPAVGDELTLELSDLLSNGQAVGRIAGIVVFVWGALPGERARVRVSTVKSNYVVANLLELEVRSSERAAPFCPVFGECGGCQVQHLAYTAQLAWKRRIVADALERIGKFHGVEVAPTVGMSHPRNYRNKIALVSARKADGTPQLGFYRARSHSLVAINGCPVALPQLDAAIGALQQAISSEPMQAALAQTKHLVIRSGAGSKQSVVSLMTLQRSRVVDAAAQAVAETVAGTVGVANSWDPASENAITGRRHAIVWGSPEMEESIGDLRFRVSAASFFQVNSSVLGAIFAHLAGRLPVPRTVVDLYCGMGAFSVFFAKAGCDVSGIEENGYAVNEARANAALNGVEKRTRFLLGRSESMLRDEPGRALLAKADIVFLDPPRKGSDEMTLGAIADAAVASVWYLSCNPATLARDLAFLRDRGYALESVTPFDMFPHTGHVETLVTMNRLPEYTVS